MFISTLFLTQLGGFKLSKIRNHLFLLITSKFSVTYVYLWYMVVKLRLGLNAWLTPKNMEGHHLKKYFQQN